ncbi:MAG: lysophospholipid acyltransferase family protein [Paracoccaceae bacterium]
MGRPDLAGARIDRAHVTYADTFDDPARRAVVRAMEWATGRPKLLARARRFERMGASAQGAAFWDAGMRAMGIDLRTPDAQVAHIPATGPVVLVANHPHGLIDGMVLGALIARRRDDFRILTRSLLSNINATAAARMIPVPFPHQTDAQARMVEMRAAAMAHLGRGGLLALFPAGVVATSRRAFGPVVEGPWSAFTAKVIRRSGATVIPAYFPGTNSRAYQIANRLSPTLRQGLLIHEVARAFDRPQAPVIGPPVPAREVAERIGDPRAFMAWLRARALALGDQR